MMMLEQSVAMNIIKGRNRSQKWRAEHASVPRVEPSTPMSHREEIV
jgi:hypothetical protein